MNVRAVPAATARIIPLPLARRRLAEASLVPLAPSVSAITFDSPPDSGRPRQRLTALFAGHPFGGPSISTRLALRSGGWRHVLVLGRSAESLTGTTVTLALGTQLAAILDGDWLQPPIADGASLVRGLAEDGRRRLLKLFLTTGASLFGRGSPEFALAARRLAETVAAAPLLPACWCPLGAGARVVSYRLPAGFAEAGIEELVAVGTDRVAPLGDWQARVETAGIRQILHLCLPRMPGGEATLVGLGQSQLHLRVPDAELSPRPLTPWLARRNGEVTAWITALVTSRSVSDPVAAALARELRQAAGHAPCATVRHLSATQRGVLFAIDLADRDGLVRALRIERGGASEEVAAGPRLTGFADLPEREGADFCRLSLVHWSGRITTVHAGKPARTGDEVPKALAADPAAVARARLGLPRVAATRIESFGSQVSAPLLSIVVPVGANLDLVRARAATVLGEPKGRAIELVYHVRSGPLAEAARAAIAQAEAVYGMAHRLVTLPAEATDADGLRAALAAAAAPRLLCLGADVLPAQAGWLAAWLARPEAARPVLGAALFDIDGSALNSGGDPRAGWPVRDLPRATSTTERVSAACVGLTREAAERLADLPHYPEADLMLAAIVETFGQDGREARVLPRSRFVRYGGPARRGALADAVDAAALELVLKPLFRTGEDEGRP